MTQRFENDPMPPGWAELEQRLQHAPQLAPRPGFARRWLALQRQREAQARAAGGKAAWLLLPACFGMTLLLFWLLLTTLSPLVAQPGSLLAALMQYTSKLVVTGLAVLNVLAALLVKVPTVLWLVLSTSGIAALLLAAMLFSNVSHAKGETK